MKAQTHDSVSPFMLFTCSSSSAEETAIFVSSKDAVLYSRCCVQQETCQRRCHGQCACFLLPLNGHLIDVMHQLWAWRLVIVVGLGSSHCSSPKHDSGVLRILRWYVALKVFKATINDQKTRSGLNASTLCGTSLAAQRLWSQACVPSVLLSDWVCGWSVLLLSQSCHKFNCDQQQLCA